MRAITPAELDRMAEVQASAMMDACELLRRSEGAPDAYGLPSVTYTVIATSACGLEHSQIKAGASSESGGTERLGTQVPTEMRLLRLPKDAEVAHVDRIRLTKRLGFSITPVVYEIVGTPQLGPSGLLATVQKVTE
jgi:hypothetical protein